MDELVIEQRGKSMASGNHGANNSKAQADLLKMLSQGAATGLAPGIGGIGGINNMGVTTPVRQNGCNLIRSYEALLQRNSQQAAHRPPPAPVTHTPGPTRRRKKKRRRQPDMPKKACTPFMHFCAYFKRKLMEEGKEFPQFADFGKRAGELWRNMGDVEKLKFNELSELDRQRYIKDMKEYEERKLAEKERERELQQQREKELQALREKELERLQKQQREQMEHQQKQMEHHQKHQQNANPALLNMLNPMSSLSPLMLAALNQSLMQTMLTNPDLLKSMYSEAAKNYYMETIKNIYQNASSQVNGSSPPSTTAANVQSMRNMDMQSPITTTALGSPFGNMGMNLNLLSLLSSSQMGLSPPSPGGRHTPPEESSPPPRGFQNSPLSMSTATLTVTPTSAALDLSNPRSLIGRGHGSSDEDHF